MSSASSDNLKTPGWTEAAAHTDPDTGELAEPLTVHVERVAAEALRRLEGANEELRRLTLAAALFHDVGKATPWFQRYLRKLEPASLRSRHSLAGAVLAWSLTPTWPLALRSSLLQAIRRHHGRPFCIPWREVERLRGELSRPEDELSEALADQLAHLDLAGVEQWLASRSDGLELAPNCPSVEEVLATVPTSLLRWKRLIKSGAGDRDFGGFLRDWTAYGALIGADRTDTAAQGETVSRVELPPQPVERFVAQRFGPPKDEMGRLRQEVSDRVRATLLERSERDGRLYTLTAPTGSGKTLAALRAVLGLREALVERGKPASRIIYCLPFTSVIDQNHAVFAEVLTGEPDALPPNDQLLKHHHLTPKSYRDSAEREWEADGAGPLLVETWQSEIVVSTFHQLLHTFLSGRAADAMRAPAWVGATVILDEVQAIPLRYWAPVGRLLSAAAEELGARFVLMTATRPLILDPEAAQELLPGHEAFFEQLDRVDLELAFQSDRTIVQTADDVLAARSRGAVLVIANTRAAVRKLYLELSGRRGTDAVVALSTTLTPRDRQRRIEQIKARTDDGEPLVVVSTQLVEAGVDLSFPTVIRDLAPLDSVIQAAGRCNRHGGDDRGRVRLIKMASIDTSGRRPAFQVYDRLLLEATLDAISSVAAGATVLPEARFLELSATYFQACVDRSESWDVDELAIGGEYDELRRQFRLIEERTQRLWFVGGNREAEALWQQWIDHIRALDDEEEGSSGWFKARSRLRQMRQRLLEHVVQEPAVEDEVDGRIHRLAAGRYHPELGLVAEGWSP